MPTSSQRRLAVVAASEVALSALLLFVVLALLSPLAWYLDAVVALLAAAGAWAWWWASTPSRVLRALGAEPADERRDARYHNLVDGLCLAFGVDRPALHVVAADVPNAASVAGRGGSHLVCTRGLLDRLGRIELEAVVAHELAHVRSGEAAAATTAVALVGYPLAGGAGPVARVLAPVGQALAPARRALFLWCLGAEREVAADLAAVGVTRYPPGLHRALLLIRDAEGPVAGAAAALAPLWIHEPGTAAPGGARHGGLHPPIEQRIDVLGEL